MCKLHTQRRAGNPCCSCSLLTQRLTELAWAFQLSLLRGWVAWELSQRVLLLNRVNVLQGIARLSIVYLLSLDFKTHLELSLCILPSFALLKPHILTLTYNFFAFIGLPWIMVIDLILFFPLICKTSSHLPIPDHWSSSHVKLSSLLQPRTGWPYSSFNSLSYSLQNSC